MVKIELGSARSHPIGFTTIDISPEFKPDIVCDLENGIPFDDNSVEEVRATHFLEHISDTIFMMNEIWRVCENGAIVNIIVPHQDSLMAFADPTHKRVFNEESFKYFCSNGEHYWSHISYGIKCNFILEKLNVNTDRRYGIVDVKLRAIKE